MARTFLTLALIGNYPFDASNLKINDLKQFLGLLFCLIAYAKIWLGVGTGMIKAQGLIVSIDAFVVAPKIIHGADLPYAWGPGYNQYEQRAIFPLEVNGELSEVARLEVIGFPDFHDIQFRLSLCYNAAICRLDYTDETHPNTHCVDGDGVPPSVEGHHFHPWQKNRRFFRGSRRELSP